MGLLIIDGEGNGNVAGVNARKRLKVQAINESVIFDATDRADSYTVNSGPVTLTTANESAVLYLKTNEDQPLHITEIIIGLQPTTGGTAVTAPTISVVRNPSTGTIVSNATAADITSNRNYGSSKQLTADVFKGVEGATVTNGTEHLFISCNAGSRVVVPVDEVLTKGDSIAVLVTPQASNTNMIVYAALPCYLKDDLS